MGGFSSEVYKSAYGRELLQALYDRQLMTIPVPHHEFIVKTRFGETHVIEYGNPDGVPVLGFHGGNATNPYSLRAFVKNVDMTKLRLIVPDTIGNIGYSAETKLSSSNMDYGKWACDIMDALHMPALPVFGGSYGGGIALRLASFAPERIERLMLIIPSGIANANPLQMARIGLPTIGYMLRPTCDEKLKKAVSAMVPSINNDFLEMTKLSILHSKFDMVMPRNATKKELMNFMAPVFVIAEEFDCLFPGRAVLKRAKKVFPNLVGEELISLGGHGAFLMDEDTHYPLYDRITEFLLG